MLAEALDSNLLIVGVFIVVLLLLEGGYLAFRVVKTSEKREVRRRLGSISTAGIEDESIDIIRKKLFSNVPWLDRLLSQFPIMERLNHLLEEANAKYPLGVYLLASLVFALVGYLGGISLAPPHLRNLLVAIPCAVLLGTIPFLYLLSAKKKRMKKFLAQLPEALELIARSLRAGHAFSGGLKMVADEMGDPIGVEFAKTLDEINFGVGVPQALKNFSERVDCPDLKFFVISVIIQRETGGNLAEILESLAYLIRERFKLQGKIRVLAAQGKLSAVILVLLPFIMAGLLSVLNRKYIDTLFKDPVGQVLSVFALVMTVLGIFAMRKMIAIRV
jgi:tight adherence protein B